MESQRKSAKQINLIELYRLNVKTLWVALRQENLTFWFLCIYFFFEYVRPQSIYPALDFAPWAQIFLMLTLLSALSDRNVKWVGNPVNKLLVLFFSIIVLSGIFAFSPSASWEHKNVILGWLLVYFMTVNIINTEKRLFLFFLAYLLFNMKMSQHGAISWASRGFTFTKWGLIGSPGWFRNSGEFAIQMLIFGSLAIAFVVSLKDHWGRYKKLVLYAAAATGYMSVIGASSRGAQLALAVMGIWFMLHSKNGLKGFIVIIILFSVLYAFLPEQQIQRFSNMGEDVTSLQRLVYWELGISITNDYPLLGLGYKNWIPYVGTLYPDGIGPLQKIEVPHSIYVEAASELGYSGLICFAILILTAFVINSQTRKLALSLDNQLFINLSYGLEAGLIGFLVAGAFVTVLYYPFFWIQIAMIVALNNVSKNLKSQAS